MTTTELEQRAAENEREEAQRLDQLFADNAEWAYEDPRHGFVYFVESDFKIKIGWTKDVRRRIAEMQTCNPNPIELRDAIADDNAPLLEQLLHSFFAEHRQNGEWFSINAEELEEVAKAFEHWADHIHNAIELMFQ